MALLGTLELDLSAPTARLSADLDRAQQMVDRRTQLMRQSIAQVRGETLSIKVDDRALTDLNRHLDLKQAHYKRVQQDFSKPLMVKVETLVDDRQLNRLSGLLNEIDRPRQIRIDLPDTIGGLTKQLRQLALSPVTIPVKIAQNAIGDVFTGMFEGLGRELSRNFSKGFSSSVEGFIQRRTGSSMGEFGEKSGKYVARNTYLWGEYISRSQGYENGLRGVGGDIAAVGSTIDGFVNPRRFRQNIRTAEDRLVGFLEKKQAGDDDGANALVEEAIAPFKNAIATIAKRAGGVGLRAAAQPYRIRKRARLRQSISEAEQMAQDLEIPNYDREKAEAAESINLVMGGIDFNGTRNTAFASRLMGQVMPKGYTIPLTTPWSNTPVGRGGAWGDLINSEGGKAILSSLLGKEGVEGLDKMPVSKLLQIAIDKGYNPDAVRGYAHVKKLRDLHPDKQINVMGTSGGSAVAEEIISLAERDGDKNVRGLGIGLPFHGLTGTAGKQFKGTIGDLDNLMLAAYGTQYTQRQLTPEQLAKLPFNINGLLAPDRSRSAIIPNAGVDHNIGMFSTNAGFQSVANKQLGSFINPDLTGRQGIVNLNPYVQFGHMDQDLNIPRTLKAMFGDRQARKDIVVGGEYSYYVPNHPDWRRDNDFGMMKSETASKFKSVKGLPKEHADEYLGFLDTVQRELTAFYDSKGKIKPTESLKQAAKFYPELRQFATEKTGQTKFENAFQYREQPIRPAREKAAAPVDEPIYDPFENAAQKLRETSDRNRAKRNKPKPDIDPFAATKPLNLKEDGRLNSAADKFDKAASKFERAVDRLDGKSKYDPWTDGEFVEVGAQSRPIDKALSAGRTILNEVSKPLGTIRAAAEGGEKGLFTAVPALKGVKGAMQIGGTLALGAAVNSTPLGGAAISSISHLGQTLAHVPISQFAGMTSGGIESILANSIGHLPGGAGIAQSIAVEIGKAMTAGGGGIAGTVADILSPYLVAKLGLKGAGAVANKLLPNLNSDNNRQIAGGAERLMLGGAKVVRELMPVTTIEPLIQLPPAKNNKALPPAQNRALPPAQTRVSLEKTQEWTTLVRGYLDQEKANIEAAIEAGDAQLVAQYRDRLREKVNGFKAQVDTLSKGIKNGDAILENPDDRNKILNLIGGLDGNIGQKRKLVGQADRAIDLMDGSNIESTRRSNLSGDWKRWITGNIRRNMGNESGFGLNPLAVLEAGLSRGIDAARPQLAKIGNIPGLGFLNTPVSNLFSRSQPQTPPPLPNGIIPPPAPRPPARLLVPSESARPVEQTERATSALDKLIGVGKLGLGVFGGYTLISLGVPAMVSLGKATIDTAANFETLAIKITSASSSLQAGRNLFSSTSAFADRIGVRRSGALETAASISGAMFGTELEGDPSDKIAKQVIQLGQLRGLGRDQSSALNLVLKQILGKPRVSAEEINQLTESAGISDARAIGARALGYTPQQFAKIAESSTGIDPKLFVTAFLRQGLNDAQLSRPLIENSTRFKEDRLGAQTEQALGNTGNAISPIYKAGVDLLTGALELLNNNAGKVASLLSGAVAVSLGYAAVQLYSLARASDMAGLSLNVAKMGWAGLTSALVPTLRLTALAGGMFLIGEGIDALTRKFTDKTADIGKAARELDAIDVIGKGKKPEDLDLPTDYSKMGTPKGNIIDWIGDPIKNNVTVPVAQWGADRLYDIQRNPVSGWMRDRLGITAQPGSAPQQIGNNAAKDAVDFNNNLAQSSDSIERKTKEVIQKSASVVDRLRAKDLELSKLSTERSGLFASGDADPGKSADLNNRYKKAFAERDAVRSELDEASKAAQSALDQARNNKAELAERYKNKTITKGDYIRQSVQNEIDIKNAEEAQKKLNEAIKSGLEDLVPWTRELDKIAAKFEDINVAAQTSTNKLAIIRNNAEMSGIKTRGEVEARAYTDREDILVAKNKAISQTIKELQFSLNSLDPAALANVRKSYGVNDNTSSAQLKILADTATSAQDKQVLTQLATIREKRNEQLANLTEISNARADLYRKVYDENQQARLYYVSLAKTIDPVGTAFNKAISDLTVEKNRLVSKLQGLNNGLFDTFTNSVIEMFGSIQKRLEVYRDLANQKKQALDTRTDIANQRETTRQNSISNGIVQNDSIQVLGAGGQVRGSSGTQSAAPSAQAGIGQSGQAGDIAGQRQAIGIPATRSAAGGGDRTKALANQTQQWVDAQERAANAGMQQTIANAEANARATISEQDLKDIQAQRDAQRKMRQEKKAQAAEKRRQQLAIEQLAPSISQEEKQRRELRDYDYSSIDKRDELEERSIAFNEKAADYQKIIIPALRQYAAGKAPELAKLPKEERDRLTAGYKQQLNDAIGVYNELAKGAKFYKDLLNGYNKQVSNARAKIVEQQNYEKEKTAEDTKLKEREIAIGKEKTALTGLTQQSELEQFNQPLKTGIFQKSAAIELKEAENERTRAMREITERRRNSEAYTPEMEKRDRKNAEESYRKKLGNIRAKQKIEQTKFGQSYEAEDEGLAISTAGLKASGLGVDVRGFQQLDKTDAPYSNTRAIDAQLKQRTAEFDKTKLELAKQLREAEIKYKGSPLLDKARANYEEQLKQAQQGYGIDKQEYQYQLNQFGIGQRKDQFDRGMRFYDADLNRDTIARQALSQRGGDTRELDLDLAVRSKQKEYATKLQDLQSQRDAITGTGEAADRARGEIDALMVSTRQLANADIANISDQFDRLNQTLRKTQDATLDVFTEFAKTGRFDWRKILLTGLDDALKQITAKLIPDLFSSLYRKPEGTNPIVSAVAGGATAVGAIGGGVNAPMVPVAPALLPQVQPSAFAPIAPPPAELPSWYSTPIKSFDRTLYGLPSVETPKIEIVAPPSITAPPMPADRFEGIGTPPAGYKLPSTQSQGIGGSLLSMALPSLLKVFGLKDGGMVEVDPSFKALREGDNPIANALKKEGHNAVLSALTPGERVLNLRQTAIYELMFPKGIENHANGGIAGGVTPVKLELDPKKTQKTENNNFNFEIDNSGRGADGQLQSRQLIDGLRSVVTQELLRHKRSGSGLV